MLTGDNRFSCYQYIVQYQRIMLTLPVSVFIVSLIQFKFFQVHIPLESILIRTIGIHYTLMIMHCDTMADQVTSNFKQWVGA